MQEKEWEGGITLLMTFLFLSLFALVGVTLDSARFFGSRGYVRTASYGAQAAMAGRYNRELFQEYCLLGYGGFDGLGPDSWLEEYEECLLQNLSEVPERQEKEAQILLRRPYASVYRLDSVALQWQETRFLAEEKEFLRQLDAWIKTVAGRDIISELMQIASQNDFSAGKSLEEGLSELEDREKEAAEGGKGEGKEAVDKRKEAADEGKEAADKRKEAADNGKKAEESGFGEAVKRKRDGSTNPLEFVCRLMRDGVLSLVCDENKLQEGTVEVREESDAADTEDGETLAEEYAGWDKKNSATGMLRALLRRSDDLWSRNAVYSKGKKGKLLFYAAQMFDCYTAEARTAIPYGGEYLVSGKRSQKEAFAETVNRLFLTRTMINYAYTGTSPELQKKSLAAAGTIAAGLVAEAFIPVIQQGILLVLALEEACVDITALLDGKAVPLIKNASNFKMAYHEICLADRELFRRKAAEYAPVEKGAALSSITEGIGYRHYLFMFQCITPWNQLYQRSLDLIQQDLRERYNQTFTIGQCVCGEKVKVSYAMPLLSGTFAVRSPERAIDGEKQENGLIWQSLKE